MLLWSQNNITVEIDYSDDINDFAMIKARRKPLLYQYNDRDSTKNKVKRSVKNYKQNIRRDFIKLIANDIEEYHALTTFLEGKEFEFFSLKPKPVKPIKILIKGLPIFPKTHEIQSDLEE
ncbi:uncharacterized protein TNCV_1829211 [Trichonephila clavipes]|nr:uncharacterized protein TNCV_1829211 [Trichonephila clavipes]